MSTTQLYFLNIYFYMMRSVSLSATLDCGIEYKSTKIYRLDFNITLHQMFVYYVQ